MSTLSSPSSVSTWVYDGHGRALTRRVASALADKISAAGGTAAAGGVAKIVVLVNTAVGVIAKVQGDASATITEGKTIIAHIIADIIIVRLWLCICLPLLLSDRGSQKTAICISKFSLAVILSVCVQLDVALSALVSKCGSLYGGIIVLIGGL